MESFPEFGFPYGVIAPSNFSLGKQAGWIYTDDEDNKNQNSHYFQQPDSHLAFEVGMAK